MTLEGIDVSRWQATTPDLAGRAFAFARATYGRSPDTAYPMHAANVRRAGLVLGAYHFGVTGDPEGQAAAFLAAVGTTTQLLAIDLEPERGKIPMTESDASRFIRAVQADGHRIGLYHSLSGYPRLGQDFAWVAAWIAATPAIPWQFWQYRGDPLDLDRFAGTAAQLADLAGLRGAPARIGPRPAGATGWVVVVGNSPLYTRQADGTYHRIYYDLSFSAWVSPMFQVRGDPYGVANVATIRSGGHTGAVIGLGNPNVHYYRG